MKTSSSASFAKQGWCLESKVNFDFQISNSSFFLIKGSYISNFKFKFPGTDLGLKIQFPDRYLFILSVCLA